MQKLSLKITTIITYKIFQSHFTSSQADLLYPSVVLVPLRLLPPLVQLLICSERLAFTPVCHPENWFERRCIRLETATVIKSQSHIATDGQSVSKSFYRAPSRARDQIFTIFGQLRSCFLWGTLSDERTGLCFVYAAGSCQRSLSRVRVPWYSRPFITVSYLCNWR
jgi:hypothetical protein